MNDNATQYADVIFYGGDVITMDESQTRAKAVAVAGKCVMSVGSTDEIFKLKGQETHLVNLEGQTLLPGFIEPHTHPLFSAMQYKRNLDLSAFRGETKGDIWGKLRAHVAETPPGEWVVAVGWNALLVSGLSVPTREQLDDVSTKHAICVMAFHGHNMFCNTKTFEEVGVPLQKPEMMEDGFVRDSQGVLTGMVNFVPGAATSKVLHKRPRFNPVLGRKCVTQQLSDYARSGFTTIVATGLMYQFRGSRKAIQEMTSLSNSPVRLVVYEHEDMLKYVREPLSIGVPGENGFCPIGIKWHADGSPYSGTMAPEDPYMDSVITRDLLGFPSFPHRGYLNHDTDKLLRHMEEFHTQGYQLAAHAHGERAIEQVLDVYEKLLKKHPRDDHRFRLEHCGMMTKAQIHRAKSLGVTMSFFPDHVHYFGRALRDGILGKERGERFMPLREAKDAGHRFSIHQDSPAGGPLDPMLNIQTAVTRAMRRDSPDDDVEVLGKSFVIDVYTALKAVTIDAAWQCHHDNVIGSITPGKFADFTVLDEHPLEKDVYELGQIKVISTYRNGTRVMEANVKL